MGQASVAPSCSAAQECRRRLSYNSSSDTIKVDASKLLPKHASSWVAQEKTGPYEDILEEPLSIGAQECHAAAASALVQVAQKLPQQCTVADCLGSPRVKCELSSGTSAECAELKDEQHADVVEPVTCKPVVKAMCDERNTMNGMDCSAYDADLTYVCLELEDDTFLGAQATAGRENSKPTTGNKSHEISDSASAVPAKRSTSTKTRLSGCSCCFSNTQGVSDPARSKNVVKGVDATPSQLQVAYQPGKQLLSPRQQEEHERAVSAFLRENGFDVIVKPKRKSLGATTYALHCAASQGLVRMTQLLLEAGADLTQKNSWGQTATDVAKKCNKRGSHAGVLEVLLQHGGATTTNS